MNSDPEDTFKRPRDPNEPADDSTSGSPPSKKLNRAGPNEHAKPKRRRRGGKKRKQRKVSGSGAASGVDPAEDCFADQSAVCEKHSGCWDSDEEDIEVEDYHTFSDVVIRPTDVPKAPENSTTFIIDDHNECKLYWSFENPNPHHHYEGNSDDGSEIYEPPESENAAYNDIDYEYESPHDFDKMNYYDKDFELSYKNSRCEELMRLSHKELVSGIQNNQERLSLMHTHLFREGTHCTLERLQSRLLEEQEKHSQLLHQNLLLRQSLRKIGVELDTYEDTENVLIEERNRSTREDSLEMVESACEKLNEDLVLTEEKQEIVGGFNLERLNSNSNSPRDEPLSLCSEDSLMKQSTQSALNVYNQKENSESPCHVPCLDASNKENACYDDEERLQTARCTPRHESCNDSCIEHIRVKEKGILRDSEFNESQCCEEMSHTTVSEEHEMNVVAV